MKKYFTQFSIIAAFFVIIAPAIKAQTYVSGGIYSNTTWTLANSPYIVTDTVVVFPGVTLTIEPGVVVKFDNNKRLEIRQAKLIAKGTCTDSITFTSNSTSPTPGVWPGIFFNSGGTKHLSKFRYCNFLYAHNALEQDYYFIDSLIINNSKFSYNNSGIGNDNGTSIYVISIDSSSFTNNTCGIGSYVNNPNGTRMVGGTINPHCSLII